MSDTKNKVIGKINEIKTNINSFIADVDVNELKSSINVMMKDAQKDISKLVEKDLETVLSRLKKERSDFESKAKKFIDGHKKELATLQEKFDKLVKATSKLKKPKSTSKKASSDVPTSRKKVIKKAAAKATAKKAGFKPKATKKASKKA